MANSKAQPQPLSADQRKGLTRLLTDAKERTARSLESYYGLDQRIEAEILPNLARDHGATSVLEKVRRLRKECEEAEKALGKLGFSSRDSDTLSLTDKAPKEFRGAVEDAQKAAREERDAKLLVYDKAILRVWAAETAREAKEIVEEFLKVDTN